MNVPSYAVLAWCRENAAPRESIEVRTLVVVE